MKLAILLLLGHISANDLIEGHNDDLVMIEEQGDKATPWNPSKSREEFEKQRKAAADLVAEQVKFETTKSADVAKRNNDNIKTTYEKNAATREKFMTATRGGLTYVDKTAPSLAQRDTPDESRKVFEDHVNTASNVVSTQQQFESTKTADVAKRNHDNVTNTFNEKNRVRRARADQVRSGPALGESLFSLAEMQTPDESRASFDKHVATAA